MDIASLRQAHFEHWRLAAAIRTLTLDAVAAANSGHSGMPMGMADVATVLFDKHLRFDPKAPFWPDRDRFILSNGHGSMLLYSLLYLTGYRDMPIEEIKRERAVGEAELRARREALDQEEQEARERWTAEARQAEAARRVAHDRYVEAGGR